MEKLPRHTFPECEHIQRQSADQYDLSQDEALELAQAQMRVIPMFEQNLYEYKIFKYYSLARNDLLRCRWAAFINSLEGRVKTPFVFPSYDNLHFNCHKVRYEPNETITNRPNIRRHLTCGPGVDMYGQIPIADDMHLRKSIEAKHGEVLKIGRKHLVRH
ncbi:uncharacterized protein LOC113505457 [Trichoplusia ni]|uniref:Uncharacterized protein LOC113505457 n=1 Tax=Trichoplusia ni TaxID=7111 RepID=A0A7E5WUW6_TRINI|nr:uncharacterized protein LOC113505457 [Trichoplusia ni]